MNARSLFPILFAFLVVALGREGTAGDAPKQPPMIFSTDLSGGDLQFLKLASEQGMLQATLGVLAADHAQSSEVRDFGESLAKQHSTQNEQLKLLAIKKGVTLSASLNPQQNATANKLSKLQGLKFDKAFMEEMITEQQNYETIFEQAVQSHDTDIKTFATTSLPEIKRHLELVRKITGISAGSAAGPRFRGDVPDPGKPDTEKN